VKSEAEKEGAKAYRDFKIRSKRKGKNHEDFENPYDPDCKDYDLFFDGWVDERDNYKCEACGVSLVKGESMLQTVEQGQYMQALTEKAMLKDKQEIERLKMKLNQCEQRGR